MTLLQVCNLSVTRGGKPVLDNISLKVRAGEKVLIRGESGSGKSTLLRALLFFEPDVRGEILLHGKEIGRASVQEYRARFSYVGQRPPIFSGTVRECLDLPFSFAANRGVLPDDAVRAGYLDRFGLDRGITDQPYGSLSGGQQQRISIIQALQLNRPLAVLDEVTSSLDPINADRVVRAVLDEKDRTVISVSHDREWDGRGMTVYEMRDGCLGEGERQEASGNGR